MLDIKWIRRTVSQERSNTPTRSTIQPLLPTNIDPAVGESPTGDGSIRIPEALRQYMPHHAAFLQPPDQDGTV
ncbi:hypothetical protein [Paenibacillus sp. NPDC055715]